MSSIMDEPFDIPASIIESGIADVPLKRVV